jgi:hypothetical protein
MTQVVAILLNDGKKLVSSALSGASKFAPHSVKLGSASGYTPSEDDTSPSGLPVYEAGSEILTSRIIGSNLIRYTVTLAEGIGPFSFGNCIIYANDHNGSVIPFIEIVLPSPIYKAKDAGTFDSVLPFPQPGSRLLISVILKHSIQDEPTVTVNVTAPIFSSIPIHPSQATLPAPSLQPWSQFILNTHDTTNSPAFVTKRSDNTYWGMPLTHCIQHPYFGAIDGGATGDAYKSDQYGYIWGQQYSTLNETFSGQIGGFGYTTFNDFEGSVGGVSY